AGAGADDARGQARVRRRLRQDPPHRVRGGTDSRAPPQAAARGAVGLPVPRRRRAQGRGQGRAPAAPRRSRQGRRAGRRAAPRPRAQASRAAAAAVRRAARRGQRVRAGDDPPHRRGRGGHARRSARRSHPGRARRPPPARLSRVRARAGRAPSLQFLFRPQYASEGAMRPLARVLARLLAVLALLGIVAQPAAAQSILRDAETEALLKDMVDPLVEAAGLPRGAVDVVLVHDPSINAFVAGGQRIYVHSGLINAADSANEVQGVLAHELGHITGGHVISIYEGAGKATKIQPLSMLAAVGPMLAGAGDAGMAAMALGQQAAMGSFLAFSRTQESSADAAAVQFLKCAGISGRGAVAFFRKLQNLEFRHGYSQSDEAGFARTHPLTGDRISRLEADLKSDPAWGAPDADLVTQFEPSPAPPAQDARSPADPNCAAAPIATAELERRFERAKA